MANEIGAKLTGDNTEFIAMLKGSAEKAGQFSGEIVGKVAGKFTGFKDVATALSTAIGLNIVNIAETVARSITGMSKEAEEAIKRIAELSTVIADKNIATMRLGNTEEQKYQQALKDRLTIQSQIENLNKAIASAQAGYIDEYEGLKVSSKELLKNEERRKEISELQNKLADNSRAIKEAELKKAEEITKEKEESYKNEAEAIEKAYQAKLSIVATEEKIAKLRADIGDLNLQIIASDVSEKEKKELIALTQERVNQLVGEEAKLTKEVADINAKNSEAMIESVNKRIAAGREELPLKQQQIELTETLRTIGDQINSRLKDGLDITQQTKTQDELRAKLRDVEKKVLAETIELAGLLMKGAANLTKEEKARLDILTLQKTQSDVNKDIIELTGKLVNNVITPAEKERLSVLIGQNKELDVQISKLKEVLGYTMSIARSGKSYEQQSTESLEGVRDRIKAQLDAVIRINAMRANNDRDPAEFSLRSEYQAITNELSLRRTVGNVVATRGEDAARYTYGDTITERAVRDLKDPIVQTQISIKSLETLFTQLFGKG